MPAEILREEVTTAPTGADAMEFPAAPPAPLARAVAPSPILPAVAPRSFADVARDVRAGGTVTPADVMSAGEREAEQARIRAAAMRPEYANIREALTARDAKASAAPQAPTLPEPPRQGLRDFLAPSDGESPVQSIGKLVQALALFATTTSGVSRHNAAGALAALSGAMQGWAVGDGERAALAYKDWEAKTQTALKTYETQRQAYNDALTAANLTLDGRVQQAKLRALAFGDEQAVLALESKDLESFLKVQTGREDAASKLTLEVQKMIEARTAREAQIEEARARREDAQARHDEMMGFRRDTQAWREQDAAERAAERKERADDKARLAAEGKVLPAGQIEALADMRAFVRQLGDVKDAFNPSYTGPVADWLKWAKSKSVGLAKPEEQFRSMLSNFENTLLKLRSGAAVTAQEYERLKRELPTTADPPGKFLAKLETTRSLMEQVLATRQATYKSAGYKVPDLSELEAKDAPKNAQTITLPDGTKVEVSR